MIRRTASTWRKVGLRASVLAAALWSIAAAPALPRSITMADVIQLHGVNPRDLSFDRDGLLGDIDADKEGDSAAFRRQVVQWVDGRATPIDGGFAPAKSPDGRWLLYAKDRLWLLKDLRTGAVRTYDAGAPITVFSEPPVWSADSRYVAANFELPGESVYRSDSPKVVAPGVRVVIRDQRDGSPPPSTLEYNPRLLLWRADQAAPIIQDTGGHGAYAGSWRKSAHRHVYIFSIGQEGGVGLQPFTLIKAINADTLAEHDLYRLASFNQTLTAEVSPDDRSLAFIADPTTPEFAVSGRVLVLDLDHGGVRNLAPSTPAAALRWGSDGRIYFLTPSGGLPQLCSVGLDGKVRVLTHDEVARRDLAVSADGRRLAYVTTDGYGRSELRRWTVGERREKTAATVADPGRAFELGTFERFNWSTPDGVSLAGFLVRPPGFDGRRRYPLLVDIHGGGPGSGFGYSGLFGAPAHTPLDWHAWAALGYIVFVPDFRSSGLYGQAVNLKVASAVEDLGGVTSDALDIASGVRALLSRPYVDASRVAAIAHSSGGPRLAFLLTRTQLFSAAMLDDPAPFGPDALTLSLVRYGAPALWTRAKLAPAAQTLLGADFLFDGWMVRTPTLLTVGDPAHGALDPLSAETLYAMLLTEKVATRFVRYVDDGHMPASRDTAFNRYTEMAAWLGRYAPPNRPAEP